MYISLKKAAWKMKKSFLEVKVNQVQIGFSFLIMVDWKAEQVMPLSVDSLSFVTGK